MTRDKRDRNNMTGRHHQSEMHAFMRDRHDSVWRGSTCRGGVGYRTTGKANFSRVQDFGSKVEFLADVMCESWTVKVAIFSPNDQF